MEGVAPEPKGGPGGHGFGSAENGRVKIGDKKKKVGENWA